MRRMDGLVFGAAVLTAWLGGAAPARAADCLHDRPPLAQGLHDGWELGKDLVIGQNSKARSELAYVGVAFAQGLTGSPGTGEARGCRSDVSSQLNPRSKKAGRGLFGVSSGVAARAVVLADVNGDGYPDGIVLAQFFNRVAVYVANPDGSLQTGTFYGVGSSPSSIAVADVNSDGIADLVVTNQDSNNVSVLLGNGDGTFQQARNYPVGGSAQSVAAADFNGDGKADLAVANFDSVVVMYGNGDGSFQAPVSIFASGGLSVIAADFNGDGKADVGIGQPLYNRPPGLAVLLGNGDGTFQRVAVSDGGPGSGDFLAFADLDSDGKLDVAVSHAATNTLSILLGNGDGTFQWPRSYVAGVNPVQFSMLQADGNVDFVVSDFSSGAVLELLSGNGDGTLRGPAFYVAPSTAGIYRPVNSLAVADFDGDGNPDVATSEGSVWLGQGGGRFVLAKVNSGASQSVSGVGFVLAGDFNGDGKPDLATRTGVALGKGDGTFGSVMPYPGGVPSAGYIVAGDFNRDGKLDLAISPDNPVQILAVAGTAKISILLGNGDGTFAPPVSYDAGAHPYAIASGDFNGDGILDLAVVNYGDGGLQGPDAGGVTVLLGQGDGTFTAGATFPAGQYPAHLAAGDVNGDGKIDLVAATSLDGSSGALAVFLGNGDGTFQVQPLIATAPNPVQWVALADLNRDGRLDILDSEENADVGFFAGNGDGSFQGEVAIAAGPNPLQLIFADFDGNGTADMAVTDANFLDGGGGWTVLLNSPKE